MANNPTKPIYSTIVVGFNSWLKENDNHLRSTDLNYALDSVNLEWRKLVNVNRNYNVKRLNKRFGTHIPLYPENGE